MEPYLPLIAPRLGPALAQDNTPQPLLALDFDLRWPRAVPGSDLSPSDHQDSIEHQRTALSPLHKRRTFAPLFTIMVPGACHHSPSLSQFFACCQCPSRHSLSPSQSLFAIAAPGVYAAVHHHGLCRHQLPLFLLFAVVIRCDNHCRGSLSLLISPFTATIPVVSSHGLYNRHSLSLSLLPFTATACQCSLLQSLL